MDHQHRRAPVLDEVDRVAALVIRRRRGAVIGAAELPFVEPELFGLIGHGALVEDAGMADQAFEAVVPVAGDPIDHEAAIGAAERAGVGYVEPGILAAGSGEAEAQILKRRPAPIAVDRIGEGLAVAGRAVEIDGHRAIARSGEHPRIPAIGPAVAERALRAAVDEQQRRQALRPADGFDDLAPDGVAMRSGEMEAAHADGIEPVELVRIDRREPRRTAAAGQTPQVVRSGQRIERVEDRAVGQRHDVARRARLGEAGHAAAAGIDPEHRRVERVAGGDEQASAVRRPGDRADRAVPRLSQRAGFAAAQVAQLDDLAVGFVGCPGHRRIGEPTPVRRYDRAGVHPFIRGGEVGRRRAAVGRNGEDVHIGRVRLVPASLAHGEIEGAAVRAPGDFLGAAERLGRRVADKARRERSPRPLSHAVHQRKGEDARANARLAPRVPVAHEGFVIDPAAALADTDGRNVRAIGVGAPHVPIGPDGDPVSGRGDRIAGEAAFDACYLRRGLVALFAPDLVVTGTVGDEVNPLAVRREARRAFVIFRGVEQACRLRPGSAEVQEPQVGASTIRREIGLTQLIDERSPIGRDGRRPDAPHRGEVGRGDGAGESGRGRGEGEQSEARGQRLSHGSAA